MAKSPSESRSVMTELVLPQHTNQLRSVFGGVVMSWIDIAAAIVATRHSGRTCVTASIDELHFLRSIKEGFVVNITGVITMVHNTSCEVLVEVEAENPILGERVKTARAFLTFVALDDYGRPTSMPPLKLTTEKEKRRAKEAVVRREHRKRLKAQLESSL